MDEAIPSNGNYLKWNGSIHSSLGSIFLYPPIMMCGFVQKKQKKNISALFVILKKRIPMGRKDFIVQIRLCYLLYSLFERVLPKIRSTKVENAFIRKKVLV